MSFRGSCGAAEASMEVKRKIPWKCFRRSFRGSFRIEAFVEASVEASVQPSVEVVEAYLKVASLASICHYFHGSFRGSYFHPWKLPFLP